MVSLQTPGQILGGHPIYPHLWVAFGLHLLEMVHVGVSAAFTLPCCVLAQLCSPGATAGAGWSLQHLGSDRTGVAGRVRVLLGEQGCCHLETEMGFPTVE